MDQLFTIITIHIAINMTIAYYYLLVILFSVLDLPLASAQNLKRKQTFLLAVVSYDFRVNHKAEDAGML